MLFYLFFFHISHKFMDPNTFSLVMKRFACFITNVFVLSSTHRRCFMEKGVLKNFTKFTGKRLCRSAFLNKVADLKAATIQKRHSDAGGFL